MPWFSPTPQRDNSKSDDLNNQKAETTIRRIKEKSKTQYLINDVGVGKDEAKKFCAIMNSIEDIINKQISTGEKIRSIKINVELALMIGLEIGKQDRYYEQAQEVFDNMKGYFKKIDNGLRSSADLNVKLNYIKNIRDQFDDKYRNLF